MPELLLIGWFGNTTDSYSGILSSLSRNYSVKYWNHLYIITTSVILGKDYYISKHFLIKRNFPILLVTMDDLRASLA
jgi:hypothetical protein